VPTREKANATPVRSISTDEVDRARSLLAANARELLEESDLLIKHGKVARSYTLAHLACEELAKIPMVCTAALRAAAGEQLDWNEVVEDLRRHASKLKVLPIVGYFLDGNTQNDADVRRLKRELNGLSELNQLKNASIYVDYDNEAGTFKRPAEVVTKEMAESMREEARRRYDVIAGADGRLPPMRVVAADSAEMRAVRILYQFMCLVGEVDTEKAEIQEIVRELGLLLRTPQSDRRIGEALARLWAVLWRRRQDTPSFRTPRRRDKASH
jgi:AbiV family abortive infection protein